MRSPGCRRGTATPSRSVNVQTKPSRDTAQRVASAGLDRRWCPRDRRQACRTPAGRSSGRGTVDRGGGVECGRDAGDADAELLASLPGRRRQECDEKRQKEHETGQCAAHDKNHRRRASSSLYVEPPARASRFESETRASISGTELAERERLGSTRERRARRHASVQRNRMARAPPKGLTTLTFFFTAAYTRSRAKNLAGRSHTSGAQGVK